jgi:dolichol-phosphate mannosyltransferase
MSLAPASADKPAVLLSVVVPVFQAERTLEALCKELAAVLDPLGVAYEIILVDDRSKDRSWSVILGLVPAYPSILAVRLSRNFGQHYAVSAGLALAQGDWCVVMDCDLQDRPRDIPRLIEKAREGFDIVLARRQNRTDPFWKSVSSRVFYKVFSWLSSYPMDPSVGTFRILRRPVVDAFRRMPENFRLFGAMIYWLGFETAFIDVEQSEPEMGRKSSYNLTKLLRLAMDGMVGFSNRPLQLSIVIGFAMSLASGAFAARLLIKYLIVGPFTLPGWLSTVTITAFMGGLILLNLGIIGIYVGRIYDHTKGRPLYVVDTIVGERKKG